MDVTRRTVLKGTLTAMGAGAVGLPTAASAAEPAALCDAAGRHIRGDHNTVFRMKNGKLGLVYSDHALFPLGHPGRDGGAGVLGDATHGTKLRAVPLDWLRAS